MAENGIEQAVILAGGMGTRLRPITDTIPKPMVLINGRPFLLYLIELLKENGIEEVLLLLGYKHENITEYFGDGSKFGVRIKYSIGAVEDETGTRLRNAKDLLQDEFLLMYCDNYWPLRLEKLYKFHKRHGTPATVTIYTNKHNITKNNIVVEAEGFVALYDKTRTAKNPSGVEIGFFILNKRVLNYAPKSDFSFEKEIFPKLIAKRELAGYLTDQRYYSIGSVDRLPLTAEFLSDKKVVLLDRDGVINKKPPKADYVKTWDEFEFLPWAIEAIKLLNDNGFQVYVITNQPGIARGVMSKKDLDDINANIEKELKKSGARVHGIYQCLHGWDDGCDCRKPRPGLLYQAAFEHNFDLTKAVFIGDDERDLQTGEAAVCPTILVGPKQDLLRIVKDIIKTQSNSFHE